jgi:hypothetical protein
LAADPAASSRSAAQTTMVGLYFMTLKLNVARSYQPAVVTKSKTPEDLQT